MSTLVINIELVVIGSNTILQNNDNSFIIIKMVYNDRTTRHSIYENRNWKIQISTLLLTRQKLQFLKL